MRDFDTIIIGAGHNGLVCATQLAKAGQRVLVLEAQSEAGGLARAREFHPGFKAPVAPAAHHFSPTVARALGLEQHGLTLAPAAPFSALAGDGTAPRIVRGESLSGASAADSAAWPEFRAQLQRFADALEPSWHKTMPRIAKGPVKSLLPLGQVGLRLRRLGKEDMREFLRVFSLPMRDLVDEHFEDEALKALLAWDGLIGSRMAPRSPNNAVLMMLYRMASQSFCAGASLMTALGQAASAAGVTLETNAPVASILVAGDSDGQRAAGVRLASGEDISAARVVSSADPQTTFVKLLGVQHLEIGFSNRIGRLRCNGLVAKLNIALDGAPNFDGLESASGRLLFAPSLDAIEFAFDASKYGEYSEHPVLEASVPSLETPELAPAGKHVLSAHVMFAPHALRAGWDEAAKADLAARALAVMERSAPGLREQMLGHELLSPVDLEQHYGVTGGHWHHTEFALDQALMMRPTYEAAQYESPVAGLWLCGAGCHPAGDLTGMAGYNAAQEVLA